MRKLSKAKRKQLKPDPAHVRAPDRAEEKGALRNLLLKRQEIPLIVGPDGTIKDGHRRWYAMEEYPDFEFEVIITDESVDSNLMQLVTDMKKNLVCYERFLLMKQWMGDHQGATGVMLAEAGGVDQSTVCRTLLLDRCIPAWHE